MSPLSIHPGSGGAVRKGIVHWTTQSVSPTPVKRVQGTSHMNGRVAIVQGGPIRTLPPTTATLIGYARYSTDQQDLAAQRCALVELGVATDRICTGHGLTGATRARPGLDQTLAAVRQSDTLVVPKLDRLPLPS